MTIRWDNDFAGKNKQYTWHDLLDDDDKLLGYVRCTVATNEFMACVNTAASPTKKFDNLDDAKNHVLTYYVVEKLEGT